MAVAVGLADRIIIYNSRQRTYRPIALAVDSQRFSVGTKNAEFALSYRLVVAPLADVIEPLPLGPTNEGRLLFSSSLNLLFDQHRSDRMIILLLVLNFFLLFRPMRLGLGRLGGVMRSFQAPHHTLTPSSGLVLSHGDWLRTPMHVLLHSKIYSY